MTRPTIEELEAQVRATNHDREEALKEIAASIRSLLEKA